MTKTHIKMNETELKTFQSIKKMLEAERELKPSDLDTIALLAVNMNILDKALCTIECEGVMISSHTAYGQTTKANPAVALLHQTQQAIRALMDSLLMSPKAKAQINKEAVAAKEDEDPLTDIFNRKASRRGA